MRNWFFIIVTMCTVVFYQNCSGRHETLEGRSMSRSTTVDDVDMAKSLIAFERTLFPITQVDTNCVQCHGVSQQPLFALEDPVLAHDVMISFGMVDLRDPPNSKIVDKLERGHQGFPQTLTVQILAAIQDWSDELVANGGLIGVGDGIQPLFSSIFTEVLEPQCISCHSPSGEYPSIDYSDYLTTLNTGQVIPGNPGGSGLFIHTRSGNMPKGGAPLTDDQLDAIAEWINRGALNN